MLDIRKIQEQVLYEKIEAASDSKIAKEIVYGDEAEPENNAAWVKNTMQRLERAFDEELVKQIRSNCQCGYDMDEKEALVQELFDASHTLEEFANCEKAKEAGLFAEEGQLYLQFMFCPCPMLADVEILPTKTWCQCTAGYSTVLFEKVFGCKVDVELLKSVKMGDETCLMRITPQGALWKE